MSGRLVDAARRIGWLRHLHAVVRREWLLRRNRRGWRGRLGRAAPRRGGGNPRVFLCGWFGTETVGDRFILLGWLIAAFENGRPDVVVLSMDRGYTDATKAEIVAFLQAVGAPAALAAFVSEKVEVADERAVEGIAPGDVLVLAGGPIMDDPVVGKWRAWFEDARAAGVRTVVGGCGLGPLRSRSVRREAAKLLRAAGTVIVRNAVPGFFPADIARRATVAMDPAAICHPLLSGAACEKKANVLAVNARYVPAQYDPEGRLTPARTAACVAAYVNGLAGLMGTVDEVRVFSTHEADRIGDLGMGREVARLLVRDRPSLRVTDDFPATMTGVLGALADAGVVVSTRFHGFLLALMLRGGAVGLDYDREAGKTSRFYSEWAGRPGAPSLFDAAPAALADICRLDDDNPSLEAAIAGACRQYRMALGEVLEEAAGHGTDPLR